jgi:opacity protein-like surface antigen
MGGEAMKRLLLILIVVLLTVPMASFADDRADDPELLQDEGAKTVTIDTKWLDDRAKLGLAIGYPWGVTFGYHFTKTFELNILLGSRFDLDTFVLGGSGLFTLVNFKIGQQIFPFSIGPAVYFDFADPTSMDALGVARLEYTFKFPLNLYGEGGVGYTAFNRTGFQWTGAVGVRYVF